MSAYECESTTVSSYLLDEHCLTRSIADVRGLALVRGCDALHIAGALYTEDRFPTGGDSDEEDEAKGRTGENPVLLLCHSCMDRTRTACQTMWTTQEELRYTSPGLYAIKHGFFTTFRVLSSNMCT
ncbi:hypothetical protein T265_07392 [Opisthorchis viverrini]|uniref:Uncharacterized protein n=1 Tax=Opisthorchis viverrini TaxID=6198 RepID=A0A075ABS2_OPIVI|nr:hypothetical protein T265_07392 [Opisthorchis viverrini]KER25104.1 hypothetical protein T265_07392 [Opisthorchis viverrini]